MGDLKNESEMISAEEIIHAWEVLEQHFGLMPYQMQVFDDAKAAETFHKTIMYVISPLVFGHHYRNKLLSKTAKQVNMGRTGPLDPVNHSTSAERRALRLTSMAMKMLFALSQLELSLLFKAKGMDFSNVLKIASPLSLLQFGKERSAQLGFPPEWVEDDETTLLFILIFLIVHDDGFQTEILQEVTLVVDGHADELDQLYFAGTKVFMDNHCEALRLCKEGLKINPFSSDMYSNMWDAYMVLGQPEYACWCATREVLLNLNNSLGYLHWIRSAEMLGNVEAATQVCEAIFFTKVIKNICHDEMCYQELTAAYMRLTGKGPPSSLPSVFDMNYINYGKENDAEIEKNRAAPFPSSLSKFKGTSRTFTETGRLCPLPVSTDSFTRGTVDNFDAFPHLYADQNVHCVTLKDNYGFIPFQWITVFPHDETVDYNNLEKFALHSWFIAVISPMTFGINYSHPMLASWIESLGYLSNTPSDLDQVSPAAERDLIKLIFQVQNFVISSKNRLMITEDELLSLYKILNANAVIARGKQMFLKIFGDTMACLDDDKQVLSFLALLLIGTSSRLSKLAYSNSYHRYLGNRKVLHLRNTAKKAMISKGFDEALKLYRQALDVSPLDGIIFGNIAQVYIEMKAYELARWFALRAIWLQPTLPKNHYRWCKATALSGRKNEALAVTDAIVSCMSRLNGAECDPLWKEIYNQRKYISTLNCAKNNNNDEKADKIKLKCHSGKDSLAFKSTDGKCSEKVNKKIVGRPAEQASFSLHTKESTLSTFCKYLRDGSRQLVDNLYKPATENYAAAMEILRKTSRTELYLTELDEALIKYCHAKALMRRHTYEHIWKAIEIFDEILHEHNIPFPMAYYGKGLAYFLLNRFTDAIEPLQKAFDIVEKTGVHLEIHVHPGLPDKLVNESCRNNLREAVIDLLDNCHSPPSPDATCHANNSEYDADSNHMAKIYSNDPEFQGYVRATCRERCHIEFHPRCFKKIAEEFKIHGDKGVIGHRCLTPDCESVFAKFEIFGSDGLVRKTLDEQVEVKVKTPKAQTKNKIKMHNESTKKGFKKRLRVQPADSNAQLKRERSRSIEPKIETAVASSPDMRSAENALRILKKFDSDTNESPKKFAARKRPVLAESRFTPIEINCADPHGRIEILQAERQAVEMGPFGRVRLNSDSPFSNPFECQTEFSFLDDYLQQSVEECRLSDMIEISSSENVGQMTTVIDFVNEFIEANGPISMSSPQFLDFINCIPIELQELISRQENGILGLLKWTTTLFIGDIAFTREKLVTALSGDSTSVNSGLDLAVPAFRRANKSFCFKNKGNLRRIESSPCFLVLRQEVVESDRATKASDYEDYVSSCGSEYCKDHSEEEESENEGEYNEVATNDTLSTVLDGTNRLLSEQLQSYKDKLFAAQKQTNFERKAKLEEMENSATFERELKEAKINFRHTNNKLEQEIKLLKNRLSAQSEEKRSIEEERRKCNDLQSEVTVLERNLAAMELNHCSVVTENRELKDRFLVLESKLAQKTTKMEEMTIKMQEMSARVDDMATKMTSHVCAKDVKSEAKKAGGVPNFLSFTNNPIPASVGGLNIACPPSLMGFPLTTLALHGHNLLHYPQQFHQSYQMPSYRMKYPPLQQANLMAGATTTRSPPLIKQLSSEKVSSKPQSASRGFDPPQASSKANESATNFTKGSAVRPASGSAIRSGGIKVDGIKELLAKADEAWGVSRSPLQRSCSTVEDTCSEGGRSCDSNVEDYSLPYAMKSKQMAATALKSTHSKVPVNHTMCQSQIIYAYLRNEFPSLLKAQFITYLELARSNYKQSSLTGRRLKDIAELVRTEALRYVPQPQAKVRPITISDDRPLDVPSFWSDGPGRAGTFKNAIVSDDVCAICLLDIKEVDAHYMRCPGRHCYHSKCIRRWYSTGKTSCPTCCVKVPLHEDFPTLKK